MPNLHHPYTHKRESQLLSTDKLSSGWGYNLSLPIKEFSHELENPERLTRADLKQKSWPATNTINGLEMLDGLLKIDGIEDGNYDAYLGSGLFEFSELVNGKTLQDLDLGGERTWVSKASWNYPTDDFAIFPVQNENFYGKDDNGDFNQDWLIDNLGTQNLFNNGVLVTGNSTFVVTPFPFIAYLLKQIFRFANYTISVNDFESNPQLLKKCLYLNQSIVRLEFINSGGIWGGMNSLIDKWDMCKIVPTISITNFLMYLQNDLNISFVFDRNREVRILDRKKQMNLPASKILLDFIVPNSTPKDFDKDENGVELTQEFDSNDELFTDANAWNEIKEDDDVRESVATFNDLIAPGEALEIRLVRDQNFYFQWKQFDVTDEGGTVLYQNWAWRAYARNQQNMQIGTEDFVKIESGFSPTYNNHLQVRGNRPLYFVAMEKYECTPKLLNYFGLVNGEPKGSGWGSIEYNAVSNDLRMGENPRYEGRWTETVKFFIDRQKFDFTMLIPQRLFRDLDLYIPYLHPEGFKFFIDNMTANQEEGKHIQEVDVEAYAF